MPEQTIASMQRALHRLKVVEAVTDRGLTQAEAGGRGYFEGIFAKSRI